MNPMDRRQWLQKSLFASSALLLNGLPNKVAAKTKSLPIFTEKEWLRLGANENPYGPSAKAKQAVLDVMDKANRYPFNEIAELKEQLAEKQAVKPSEIMVTAGSTEVLSLLGQHVGLQQGEILIPWPSFPTITRFGERCGAKIKRVDLDDQDRIDLDKLLAAISDSTTLVYVCNPNNPTSTEVDADALRAFCRKVPQNVLIAIDEAYIEYSIYGEKSSMASLVKELPHLIICRTFSKAYGLAGLRIGYALSQEQNIKALRDRHTGWEFSTGLPPLVAAKAALADTGFIPFCVQKNKEGRQVAYEAFDRWGVKYAPSSTSFIYTSSTRFKSELQALLREENIYISKWSIMTDRVRISIGKPEEMKRFVAAVEKHLI